MKILVATDGSPPAHAAIEFLTRLGLHERHEVALLTVVHPMSGYAHTEREREAIHEIWQAAQAEAEEMLARELEHLRPECRSTVRDGHTADQIIAAAEKDETDLIVVGARGRSQVQRFLLGSVSQKVVRYAPCSVMVVRDTHEQREAPEAKRDDSLRLLLAFDDSEPSHAAVEMVKALASDSDADVTVLTVLPTSTAYGMDIQERLTASWQEEKRRSRAALDRVEEQLRTVTPNVRSILQEGGDVSGQILDTAQQHNCDLIVVGSKGKGAIQRFLLGSVSNRVVHHAHCHVCIVR